jgi:hypothetical protein
MIGIRITPGADGVAGAAFQTIINAVLLAKRSEFPTTEQSASRFKLGCCKPLFFLH